MDDEMAGLSFMPCQKLRRYNDERRIPLYNKRFGKMRAKFGRGERKRDIDGDC